VNVFVCVPDYLWDDDITPLSEDWQFLHPRSATREFSDSLRARHGDIETYPQRQESSSSGGKHTAPPSRGNQGGIVNDALESGGAGNDGDISDSVIDDDDDALIINEDRDRRDEIDRPVSNRVPKLLPPTTQQGVDGGARGDGSSTSGAAAAAATASAPFSSELIYKSTDSESLSSAEIQPQVTDYLGLVRLLFGTLLLSCVRQNKVASINCMYVAIVINCCVFRPDNAASCAATRVRARCHHVPCLLTRLCCATGAFR
jgi:hypothetical protein